MLVLRPSPTHGVGVFTTAPIAKDEFVPLWDEADYRFVTFTEAENDPMLREVRDIYCVLDATGYHCPLDFHRMSVGWYLNHADEPNLSFAPDGNYRYHAVRDIEAGEELFCDYRTLTPYESAPGA